MIYEIKSHSSKWALRRETILQYVPGVLEYPKKRSRHIGFPYQVTFDISGVITGNVFVTHMLISPKRYSDCLKELIDSIEETEDNRQLVQKPLRTVLDNAWERCGRDPSQMLLDFVCFGDLVMQHNLGGSLALQTELTSFFIHNAGPICRSLPLPKSLQFVDMCPAPDLNRAMECLLAKLPTALRHELEVRGGKVRPCFEDGPSDEIKRYMQRRGSSRPATPVNARMAFHHRNAHAINQRGRRRLLDHPNNIIGRAISAERLLEQDVDMSDVARRGGRVILPDRRRRSPSQGPSNRHHHRRVSRGDGWFGSG